MSENVEENEKDLENCDHFLKILLIGNSYVGKTNFISIYNNKSFSDERISSVGIDTKKTDITIDDQNIRIQLWDSIGKDKSRATTQNCYLRVQGIMILFDLTSYESFLSCETWLKGVRETCGKEIPLLLVGNKSDLDRIVSKDDAEQFAQKNDIGYIEVSCKDNINIKEAVVKLSQIIISSRYYRGKSIYTNSSFFLEKTKTTKKKCCK